MFSPPPSFSIIDNNTEDTAVCRAFYKIAEVYSRAELSFGEDWTAVSHVGLRGCVSGFLSFIGVSLSRWVGRVVGFAGRFAAACSRLILGVLNFTGGLPPSPQP